MHVECSCSRSCKEMHRRKGNENPREMIHLFFSFSFLFLFLFFSFSFSFLLTHDFAIPIITVALTGGRHICYGGGMRGGRYWPRHDRGALRVRERRKAKGRRSRGRGNKKKGARERERHEQHSLFNVEKRKIGRKELLSRCRLYLTLLLSCV